MGNVTDKTPVELPALWRERAAFLSEYGDAASSRLWLLATVELERALQNFDDETLSLVEAARVSGFSAGHLGYLVARGKIHNAGRPNAPLIRRADLPIKPTTKGPGRPSRPRPVSHADIQRIAGSFREGA